MSQNDRGGASLRLRQTVTETALHKALQAAIAHPMQHPQILLGLNTGPGPQWDPDGKSQMARDSRFTALKWREPLGTGAGMQKDGIGADRRQAQTQTLADKLAGALSLEAAAELLGQAITAKLAAIFMLPADEIDLTQPPAQYGVDSLVAVELRNMLVLQAGAEVSIFNIMQSLSLAALALDVASKSRYISV